MARILLIDDDAGLLEALALAFADEGHEVLQTGNGQDGLALVRKAAPDLVVSDVNMAGLDGFALCRKLRAENRTVPVILLTSRDNEIDEALGLELGADDYVTKPFSSRVLLARVAALLRRQALTQGGGDARTAAPLRQGHLELDGERLEVRYRGVELKVTVTEFRILDALARRPGVVLSRERLLGLVRDDDSVVADRIIDTYVRRLRGKLEAVEPKFDGIETVIGAGYRWRAS